MKKYTVGILVSPNYNDFTKIKNTIYAVKKKLGDTDEVEICQITENGMHDDIKKFVKEIGLYHTDILKFDEPFNADAHDSNEHKFGKARNPKWFYTRNTSVIDYCYGIYGFIEPTLEKNDAVYLILKKLKEVREKNFKVFS